MPDTPENQEAFPQLTSQEPGVGFPIARACAVLSLANACMYDVAIGQLYGYRWFAELDIFSIKESLNLNHLHCKSPEMIGRELQATLLAYNMVRRVCAQAAAVHDKLPRQMSFTIASNTLMSQWLIPPDKSIRKKLGEYNLWQIACNEVGNRPGRIEPRVLKRRPKPYPLMTQARHLYQQAKA